MDMAGHGHDHQQVVEQVKRELPPDERLSDLADEPVRTIIGPGYEHISEA